MKRISAVIFLCAFSALAAKADTFHVTSGFIATNGYNTGGNYWALAGDGFIDSGSGLVGICGVTSPFGQPITPCGGDNTVILGSSTDFTATGSQALYFDGFFNVNGLTSFLPDGSDTFTYIAPVTFSGQMLACLRFCASPYGVDNYFDLTGDTGYVTMILTKTNDGFGNIYYTHDSTIYSIGQPPTFSTPEPATVLSLAAGLGFLALAGKLALRMQRSV